MCPRVRQMPKDSQLQPAIAKPGVNSPALGAAGSCRSSTGPSQNAQDGGGLETAKATQLMAAAVMPAPTAITMPPERRGTRHNPSDIGSTPFKIA